MHVTFNDNYTRILREVKYDTGYSVQQTLNAKRIPPHPS